MPKKIFIKTFGCQMNEYDSDQIANLMHQHKGYQKTEDMEDADLVVLNTCSIREKAEDKVYDQLGRIKELKVNKPSMKIAVGGCVASQEIFPMQKKTIQVRSGPTAPKQKDFGTLLIRTSLQDSSA